MCAATAYRRPDVPVRPGPDIGRAGDADQFGIDRMVRSVGVSIVH